MWQGELETGLMPGQSVPDLSRDYADQIQTSRVP